MESLFEWNSDNIRGLVGGFLVSFGEFDNIVATALHSLAGSKGRSLYNLRSARIKDCLLLVRLVWILGRKFAKTD